MISHVRSNDFVEEAIGFMLISALSITRAIGPDTRMTTRFGREVLDSSGQKLAIYGGVRRSTADKYSCPTWRTGYSVKNAAPSGKCLRQRVVTSRGLKTAFQKKTLCAKAGGRFGIAQMGCSVKSGCSAAPLLLPATR